MYVLRHVLNFIELEEIGHNIAKAGSSKLREVIHEASRCEPFAYTSVHARVLQAHGNGKICSVIYLCLSGLDVGTNLSCSTTNINLTNHF